MTQVIVFQLPGRPVSIMTPVIQQYIAQGVEAPAQLGAAQIGQKDVPAGVPFWIVDASTIPEDRTFRDAWELDTAGMGEPAGIGGTYQPEGAA